MSLAPTAPQSGMERMLMTFLRAAGFDPQQFAAGISQFITSSQSKLAELEANVAALKESNVATQAKLDRILTIMEKEVSNVRQEQIVRVNGASGNEHQPGGTIEHD